MVKVGDVIDGRYKITARIDSGAMGEVFRVFDLRLDCFRALKQLKDGQEHNTQWVERFKREAQAPSKIRPHPNVVAVHEYVSGHLDEQNRYINHYIVMELAEGKTLADLLNTSGHLPLDQAMEIMEGICNGVGAAHRTNIVHRDLKPKNVIVCETAKGIVPKIIDFGLAKLPDASRGGDLTLLTDADTKLGTPAYRAPEQAKDPSRVDARADVYSLGCIFYEILTGRRPFRSEDTAKLIDQHQTGTPDTFDRQLGIPSQVEDVVRKALKKRPSERQANADELAVQLIEARDEKARAEEEERKRREAEKWRRLEAELDIVKRENQERQEVEELLVTKLKEAEEARAFSEQDSSELESEIGELEKKIEDQRKKREAENQTYRDQLQTLTREVETQRQTVEAANQYVTKLVDERDSLQRDRTVLQARVDDLRVHADQEAKRREIEREKLLADVVSLTRVVDAWRAQFGDPSSAQKRLDTLSRDVATWKQSAEGSKRDVARLQAEKKSLEERIQKLRRPQPTQTSGNHHPIRAFLLAIVFLIIGGVAVYFGRDPLTNKIGNLNWLSNVNQNNNSSMNGQEPAKQRDQPTPTTSTAQPASPLGMVYVAGGTFQMGRNTKDGGGMYDAPSHTVAVSPFFIDKYEVTNADYAAFVNATKHQSPTTWTAGAYPSGASKKPVTGVTWNDADAYARWAGKRLPTEAEWEFAARGTTGFVYPWGNQWEKGGLLKRRSNEPSDVGSNTNNKSPFGVFDMVGNVWEWTNNDLRAYPGGSLPSNSADADLKVIRGCMYKCNRNQMTTTYRRGWPATGNYDYKNTGFRCAKGVNK